ncbi:choline dehydrogenase family protein [Campylobacter iguaniorum]|uniref:Choline dehydrogenase family protein n=1 Tax=Campylobacter iguaniorum TaxID=1244531 RepID=A0A076FC29_9BACT|nr:GMC family oxidoreductase [Campylobacter iguaniorum]AII15506.1 choline dehydrogenase family protein [Campylobacter iguaniorum]
MVYDVCIIGSGAGASPVAYELSKAGFSVVVLEKGEFYKEDDFSKDELAVSRRKMFVPELKDEYHIVIQKEPNGETKEYKGTWSFWNGSLVGGSSNLMSGFFHRLKPNDFRLKSVYGEIDGANVIDWPISYDDLEPYYTKVEEVVGVSGKVVKHKFSEPRSKMHFPYEKLEENEATKWFDKAALDLGLTPLPTPRAIISRNLLDRNACYYSHFCGGFPCASRAKGSGRVLLQQCPAKIIPKAFVYKLVSDKFSVKEALYYDEFKKSHSIKAKIFVVAAQAIETSRLLLNSKNKHFPNGLANNSNQVGKNLIFSAGGAGSGTFYLKDLSKFDGDALMSRGLFFNRFIQNWYEFSQNGKKYKGGTIDFLFEHPNIIPNIIEQFYDDDGNLLYGDKLMAKIKANIYASRKLTFEVFNDWLPTNTTFVSVSDTYKDKYGVPVALINLEAHKHDLKVGEFLSKQAVKILEKMGAKDVSYNASYDPPPNLVAGGARFGDDPSTSVLDKNCKAHELTNLYVSDASFMPTGGSVPYTWSIYANSFRVADIIKKRLLNLV